MSSPNPLLSDFVRSGSEGAFRDLVSGYVNLVYSTALRLVNGDTQLAEDIVQHVFIDLARTAVSLPANIQLGGWLYRHTCFLASKAMRGERRRKVRERRAVELQRMNDFTEENLQHLTGILDEAINELVAEDRTAILLRFFEQLDFRSIGIALGRTEDAARMRVSRALEKLGQLLRRRGFVLSAAGIGYFMGSRVLQAAPTELIDSTAQAGLAGAFKGTSYFALLRESCLTKLNVGLIGATVGVVIATLMLLGDSSSRTAEPINQLQVPVANANSEIADTLESAPEVAPVTTNTESRPSMSRITRSPVLEIAARKVIEVWPQNSSSVQPVNQSESAPPPNSAPVAAPILVTSGQYLPSTFVSRRRSEYNRPEPLSSARSNQSNPRPQGSSASTPTASATKSPVTIPGIIPAIPQINGTVRRQWASGNYPGLAVRVMDRNGLTPMPLPTRGSGPQMIGHR